MNNAGKIPVNDNLHLLMGPSTMAWANSRMGKYYANYLAYTNQTIINSYVNCMADSYSEKPTGITNVVKVGITGWASCFSDTLQLYSDPDLNGLEYAERVAFIP